MCMRLDTAFVDNQSKPDYIINEQKRRYNKLKCTTDNLQRASLHYILSSDNIINISILIMRLFVCLLTIVKIKTFLVSRKYGTQ